MTKLRVAITRGLVSLALIAGAQHEIQAASPEKADFSLAFYSVPLEQVFSTYASIAKEKLRVPANMDAGVALRVVTTNRLTRTQALKLIRTSLKEQAQFTIKRDADGTWVGIPKRMPQRPLSVGDAMRTFFPDGHVDPPFPGPAPVLQPRAAATNAPH
jgi:hypothetical protein